MIRFAIALLIGGGILTFFGYKEHQLASGADSTPQEMTAAELIANGPGDNAHIVVTDFYLVLTEALMLTPEDNPNQFDKIWSPVVPLDDPFIEELQELPETATVIPSYPDEVKLILYSNDVNNENELIRVAEKDKVQGLIINKVDKLSGEELKEFQKSINVNPDTVWVLELDRKPKSTGITMLMMVGGVLLMLAMPAMMFFGRSK